MFCGFGQSGFHVTCHRMKPSGLRLHPSSPSLPCSTDLSLSLSSLSRMPRSWSHMVCGLFSWLLPPGHVHSGSSASFRGLRSSLFLALSDSPWSGRTTGPPSPSEGRLGAVSPGGPERSCCKHRVWVFAWTRVSAYLGKHPGVWLPGRGKKTLCLQAAPLGAACMVASLWGPLCHRRAPRLQSPVSLLARSVS